MENKQRSSFSGKIGFVLAAAGSAVGLGNIWRFPYLAAQYGGGIFLLVYILLAVSFGFALMTAEIAIGRKTGLSAVGAYKALDKRFGFIGTLSSLVPAIITPYYCVIGGWVAKYLAVFICGQGKAAAADTVVNEEVKSFFDIFSARAGEPVVWFLIFLALTALVVLLGVDKGIEKVSTVMMPVLVILTLFVAIYAMFLPGAGAGIKYYLLPDFSRFSFKTVLAAMSQMFYSMSLSMGIMITYGSYMKKEVGIENSVRQIEIFDTGIAFLAGMMIVPAVFAFSGGDETALGKGAGLMFITLPKVFAEMKGGQIVGTLFFLLVLFAALTSSISLMETVVSILEDKFHWKRKLSCAVTVGICLLLGIPSSLGNGVWNGIKILGMDFLTFFDFISNSVLMPVVALLSCVFVGHFVKPESVLEEADKPVKFKFRRLFTMVIKYVAPVLIVIILVASVLEGIGVLKY